MSKKIVTDDGEVIDAPQASPSSGPLFFKTPFNYDRDQEAKDTALYCLDESRTKQSFAKDADINNILRKFMDVNPGASFEDLPRVRAANYMNVDEEFDLQKQIVTAYEVEEAWNALPVSVRNMLKEPSIFMKYVEHCLETGDLDPLRELGLAKAREPSTAPPPERTEKAAAPTSPPTGTPAAGGTNASPEA